MHQQIVNKVEQCLCTLGNEVFVALYSSCITAHFFKSCSIVQPPSAKASTTSSRTSPTFLHILLLLPLQSLPTPRPVYKTCCLRCCKNIGMKTPSTLCMRWVYSSHACLYCILRATCTLKPSRSSLVLFFCSFLLNVVHSEAVTALAGKGIIREFCQFRKLLWLHGNPQAVPRFWCTQ